MTHHKSRRGARAAGSVLDELTDPGNHPADGEPITPEALEHVRTCIICQFEYRETLAVYRLQQTVSGWDLGGRTGGQ